MTMTKCATKVTRTLLLDLPLVLLFTSLLSIDILHHVTHTYFDPLYNNAKFIFNDERKVRERTYTPPTLECDFEDISTSSSDDIILDSNTHTVQDAVDTTLRHGVSAYRNVLTPQTTSDLRSYVMYKNKNHNVFETYWYGVQSGKFREVLYPNAADDPSLIKALEEITSHPLLVDTLETLLGSNPAVYELSFITSYNGAAAQNWHQDLTYSQSHFSLTLGASFSLFIPLQNTTAQAGASNFCPGTHLCEEVDHDDCDDYGFALTTSTEEDGYIRGQKFWKEGDAALYNGNMYHRGGGHADPWGPDRILMIVSFTTRPMEQGEYRMPGLGTTWGIKYNMFGHTLNDLRNAGEIMVQPWATLRAFGVYKLPGTDWGWDYVTLAIARMANEDPGFDDSDFEEFLKTACGWVEDMNDLPSWLVGDMEEYEENKDLRMFWEFGVETLDRIVRAINYAYGAALFVYCFISIIFGLMWMRKNTTQISNNNMEVMNGANAKHHSTNGNGHIKCDEANQKSTATSSFASVLLHLLLRLFFLHVPILLLYVYTNNTISSSQWAQDVKSNTLFRPPFQTHPIDFKADDKFISYLRSIADVRSEDVIFPTLKPPGSGDSTVVGSRIGMNQVLEKAHEGNRDFTALRTELVPADDGTSKATIPLNLLQHAAKQIVQQVVTRFSSRFLVQNKHGDYTPLSYKEAVSKTQWLLIQKIQGYLQILEDTLDDMRNMCQYGPKRHMVLYNKWSIDLVEYWSVRLKNEWTKKGHALEEQRRILFRETPEKERKVMVPVPALTLYRTSPASKAVHNPISSIKVIQRSPTVSLHPVVSSSTQKCIDDKHVSSLVYSGPPEKEFDVGETVEMWEGGYSTFWIHGTILGKHEGDNFADFSYDIEDEYGELNKDVRGDEMRSLDDMDIVWG